METMPGNDPMEHPDRSPLAGLDPADLLRQGAAGETFPNGAAGGFELPPIDELAALFPRFEILELIGKGGMGAVYKVRQKDLDRIVALKILPPAIGGAPGFSDRFTREAKALAKLNHPGIVTIHEFGSASFHQPSTHDHPLFYFLMEFVDGVNLAQLMRSGRISPREALAIVPQICDALQFAHDQGIVHRDIKPENLLLDRLGRVKVADFGIAKVVASVVEDPIRSGEIRDAMDATIAGKIIGTPHYMAPEQIEHPGEVDHRADIYALGVVFYQMLTGELPGKDLNGPLRRVRIDVRLDEIVMQAMEKNPELRFQQVSVMKTRVEGLDERASEPKKSGFHPAGVYVLLLCCASIFLANTGWIPWSSVSKLLGFLGNGGLLGWFLWSHAILPYQAGLKNARSRIVSSEPKSYENGEGKPAVSRRRTTDVLVGALGCAVLWTIAAVVLPALTHGFGGSPNSSLLTRVLGLKKPAEVPSDSLEAISLATRYLDLVEEVGAARARYLSAHPSRIETEHKFALFMAENPTLPDSTCRLLAVSRRVALEARKVDMERRYLPEHPKMIQFRQQIDTLSAVLQGGERPMSGIEATATTDNPEFSLTVEPAKKDLKLKQASYEAGMISKLELESAEDKVKLLEAQATGNVTQIAEVKLAAAERREEGLRQRYNAGLIPWSELQDAVDALETARLATGRLRSQTPPSRHALLSVSKDQITLDGESFSREALDEELRRLKSTETEISVTIQSSANVSYQRIVETLDACQKAGIWNIDFATQRPSEVASDQGPERRCSVSVFGEVARSGLIQLGDGASLLDVLAGAGGWTKEANLKKVSILDPDGGTPEIHDVQAILQGNAINPVVKDRAIVTVSQKMF